MEKRFLTHYECDAAVKTMSNFIGRDARLYGVPRGGVPVAYLLARHLNNAAIVHTPEDATRIVDDIEDSGTTRKRYAAKYPALPFDTLAANLDIPKVKGQWIVFPWEVGESGADTSAEDFVIRLLQFIGEDPSRGGLKETPQRVLKAWKEWTSGYGKKPEDILKCFEDGAENYDEMVLLKDFPFTSFCEHHLAMFWGTVSIAYLPDKRIVGLSKLGRLTEIFSRRLQVQERMTTQIALALEEHLEPKGVAVLVKARHSCMESRGICRQGHETVTSALRGAFFNNPATRNEFYSMVK